MTVVFQREPKSSQVGRSRSSDHFISHFYSYYQYKGPISSDLDLTYGEMTALTASDQNAIIFMGTGSQLVAIKCTNDLCSTGTVTQLKDSSTVFNVVSRWNGDPVVVISVFGVLTVCMDRSLSLPLFDTSFFFSSLFSSSTVIRIAPLLLQLLPQQPMESLSRV